MTLLQIEVFLSAAGSSGFAAVCRGMKLSPPAVTRCIQQLESSLGHALFERTKLGITLTPLGKRFLPLARRVLQTYRELQSAMAHRGKAAAPRLDVIGSASVMEIALPLLVDALQNEFGQVAMQVREALGVEVAAGVLNGEAALGVSANRPSSPLLRCSPVLEAQFGLLAPCGFEFPQPLNSLRALDHAAFVRCRDDAAVCLALRTHGVDFPAYFESSVMVEDVSSAIELVHSRGMVTVASGIGASQRSARGLAFFPLPDLLPTTEVCIVSRREAVFDDRQERLRDLLRNSIHQVCWHSSVRRIDMVRPESAVQVSPAQATSSKAAEVLARPSEPLGVPAKVLRAQKTKGPSLQQVRVFLCVAQLRSTTLAGKSMCLTQSAVSRTVQELEHILGLVLFDRRSRSMTLTEAGRALLPHARALVESLEDSYRVFQGDEADDLKLAVSDVLLPYILPDLLTHTEADVVSGKLRVLEMNSHQVVDRVARGGARFGLCFTPKGDQALQYECLMECPIGMLVGTDVALPQTIRSLDDVAHLRWARWSDDLVLPQLLHANNVKFDAFDSSPFVTDSMQTAYSAVASGRLVTLVPALSAHFAMQTGYAVRFLPLPHLLPQLQVSLVGRHGCDWRTDCAKWIAIIQNSLSKVHWPA